MSVKYKKLKIVVWGMVLWVMYMDDTCGELWYYLYSELLSIEQFTVQMISLLLFLTSVISSSSVFYFIIQTWVLTKTTWFLNWGVI
jgi:hypothetical protein